MSAPISATGTTLRLAARFLRRDLAAGRLGILAAALVVAVAAVTAVGWLGDRVGAATTERAAELIAADRLVRTDEAAPDDWLDAARERGLQAARTVEFPTVVAADGRTRLVSVKAVESGYPLRGELRTADARDADDRVAEQRPGPGAVWVEPRLLDLLGAELGGALEIGDMQLPMERLVTAEPDRAGMFGTVAPRVLLAWEDIAGTGLVGEGARVRHALLLAGPEDELDAFAEWLRDADGPEAEVLTGTEAQPAIQEIVGQAERFLGLAALITVVVAAAAVLLTARHYAVAQLDRVAVMRVLGARQGRVVAIQTAVLGAVALAAGVLGAAIGFALHAVMIALLADVLPPNLPAPGPLPALYGIGLGVAAAAGFALPTVARLRHVPPMRVLRRTAGAGVVRSGGAYAVAAAVIAALMVWRAGDLTLAGVVLGATAATLAALAAAAYAAVRLAGWLRARSGSRLLWLTGPSRRPGATVVQVVAVGLGLMALLLLSAVREDLLDTWQAGIPDDAPDTFLIDVAPEEVEPLQAFLAEELDTEVTLYAITRGRLDAINEARIRPDDFDSPRTQRMVDRDLNLTWAETLPEDNRVVAGEWWGDEPGDEWSVEAGYAERVGIDVGDEITFVIDGEPVSGTVTSLRELRWDSFNPNFFVIAAPGMVDAHPEYITSFRLGDAAERVLPELNERFPGATPLDVGAILDTARRIIGQGARVVELMAALTLVAGVVVLLAALRTAAAERRFEASLLRALGASRRRLEAIAVAELAASGALAGLLAGIAAASGGYLAARHLFDLTYAFPWGVVVLGTVLGAVTVAGAGWLGARRDWRVSPMELLRGGES
ncbi:ABC transporter permease [Halorhodospira halophila]|uniref:ABC3 transporter permease C-terminal domain-containing protein n=1 Tax=Halorhodospira halophila (strain DSM 244 / SL1) TaxID=349124 RepID=A1WYR8_HALHL|nr:FtsX-like permease family protein [Halorhodospira halophila]ABM62830.1 protein of unknown function DUF214 [Halorhodospira halophila SL1]MBK1728047.1 hypothetical protein [Halorhodospira halophila]